MAAHELLTPLTVVAGYLSLLSGGTVGSPPEAWEAPLGIVLSKTYEMERIVDDLLNASRLDVTGQPLAREVLDLRRVVDEAVERVRPRADLLGADVTVDLPYDPVPVEADASRLGRVMTSSTML